MKLTKQEIVANSVALIVTAIAVAIMIILVNAREEEQEIYIEPTCHVTVLPTIEETEEVITEPTQEETVVTEEAEPLYSAQELEYLAMVIYQEAGSDYISDETRLMVGTVVMNRVADPRFPDTIHDVLTQKRQYGRFYWTGLVWPERASTQVEAHAVQRAYECAEKILNGYRSFDASVVWQAEFVQGSATVAYQDGIYFCR